MPISAENGGMERMKSSQTKADGDNYLTFDNSSIIFSTPDQPLMALTI